MREGAVTNGSAVTTASGGGSCAGRSPSSRSAIHSRHSVSLEPTLCAQNHPISCWNLFGLVKTIGSRSDSFRPNYDDPWCQLGSTIGKFPDQFLEKLLVKPTRWGPFGLAFISAAPFTIFIILSSSISFSFILFFFF